MTVKHLTIDHDTASDTCSEGDHDEILHTLGSAVSHFTDSSSVCVICKSNRKTAHSFRQKLCELDGLSAAPHKVDSILDRTLIIVAVRCTYSDTTDLSFLVSILVRALLEKIQSPLCDSVSVDRNDRIGMDQVVLTEIAEQGVAANVSEQGIPMLLGSAAYMQSHGVAVQDRWTNAPEHRGRRLICVAIKDRIVAIFLARYRLADDMKALLLELEAEGVQIVIRSKDPGIHDDLFASLLPDRKDAVKVMKPSVSEIDLRTDRVDATVVALGSCREAARTFVTCRRVRRAGNLGKLLQVLSIAGGAVLAAVLTFLAGAVRMPAILVSLYLLFWCGVHAATSYFYLRDRDEDRS